ncbi:tyrosine-type recombinase/integrase [Methanothrix sp.]|uniref:tyrosine-type recombinase/integrase n=1 Tax=Methanothrix sp. TaxID=90426 RepID=UPI003BB710DE
MPWVPTSWAKTADIIFEGRDLGHISTRQIQRLLDDAAENAGLQEIRVGNARLRKRITPHLLRHSFSRWSLDAGIDVSYLQHQSGHSSLTTTAIFLQARPNHRRKAYEKAGFDQLLNPVDIDPKADITSRM